MAQEGGVKFLYNALPALGGAAAASQDAEPTRMPFRDDAVTLDAAELDILASDSKVAVENALYDAYCQRIAYLYEAVLCLHMLSQCLLTALPVDSPSSDIFKIRWLSAGRDTCRWAAALRRRGGCYR